MSVNKIFNVENPRVMLKNSIINLGAATFTKIIAILLIPIYTRILTTDEYGQMELILILGNFFIVVYPSNLQAALGRMYFDFANQNRKLKVFISTIIMFVAISSIIQLVLYLFIGYFFFGNDNFLNLDFFPFVGLIILASSLRVFLPIVLKLLQNRGDSIVSSWFSVLYAIIGMLLNILFIVVLKMGIIGFIYAFSITSVIVFIATFFYLKNDIIFKIDKEIAKEAIAYSFPLLLSNVILFIYQYIDRFILAITNSISDVGIYALATKIALLLSLLHVALNRVLNPYLYSNLNKKKIDKNRIAKVFNYNILLFITIGFLLALFSKEFVYLLAPSKYSNASFIAPILILGYVFQAFYFNSVRLLFFYKKTKIISISSIIVGIINLILAFIFIPKYGSIAAALIFFSTIIIHSIIIHYYSKRIININFQYNKLIIVIIFISFVYTAISFINIESKVMMGFLKSIIFILFLVFVNFKFVGIYEFKKIIKNLNK